MLKLTSVVCLIVTLTTSCAPRLNVAADSACTAFAPIYLSEQSIAAMPRADKQQIAAHNRTWERTCGNPLE